MFSDLCAGLSQCDLTSSHRDPPPALAPAPNPRTNLFTWTSPCRDYHPMCPILFPVKHRVPVNRRWAFNWNPFLLKLSMHNSHPEYLHLKGPVHMYENQQRFNIQTKTRLHSCRMRTARVLTISPNMLCGRGGGSALGGGVWSRRGVCSRGVSALGGCLLLGVSALGLSAPGVCVSQHALRQTPPCEQNHTRLWKHNLAPTSLRAVKIANSVLSSERELKKTSQQSDRRQWQFVFAINMNG